MLDHNFQIQILWRDILLTFPYHLKKLRMKSCTFYSIHFELGGTWALGKDVVELRDEKDAQNALLLNGEMWDIFQLEVIKNNYLVWLLSVGRYPTFFHRV